jgi:hypothetical protein
MLVEFPNKFCKSQLSLVIIFLRRLIDVDKKNLVNINEYNES